ncbi:hypothetical protein LUZ63_022079 [Rhynchospora breviuscula]|uniref:Uncharacterized protein n=1 Tax=Rhynchospora breviuscula TaxID=2022672 RepID=A0A9Q0BYW4_9POAL|nr:hypothetical protein LUZ63_022079 [Rhynchospora breviuscula]
MSSPVSAQQSAFAVGVLSDLNTFNRFHRKFPLPLPYSSLVVSTAYALRPIIPDNACILCITAAAGTELADAYSSDTVIASSPRKEVYDPWAFFLHAALLRQAFAHCGKFLTAASRRSLGRVSVPVWLIILSDQLLIIALVKLLPHQLANQTRAPPRADSSFCSSAYGVLATVSSCCSPPKGRFLRVTHPSATGNTTSRPTCMC